MTEAGVRENAITLTEPHLKDQPALVAALLKLENDPSPKVRFHAAMQPGVHRYTGLTGGAESTIAERLEDDWMQLAALSASSDRALQYFEMASARRPSLRPPKTMPVACFCKVGAVIERDRSRLRCKRSANFRRPPTYRRVPVGGVLPVWKVWPMAFCGGSRIRHHSRVFKSCFFDCSKIQRLRYAGLP